MMADLTEKVLGMLDDPTLEAVKVKNFCVCLNINVQRMFLFLYLIS